MRPLFLALLLPLLLAFGGCAKQADPSSPGGISPEQSQELILSSLSTASLISPLWVDFLAGEPSTTAGCVTFAAVGLVAPTLHDSLELAYAQTPVPELPAVAGSAASCGLPEIQVLDPAEVQRHTDLAFGHFYGALAGFAPQLQAIDCRAYAITMAAGDYAHALAPALLQVPTTWAINVPAYQVDYSACAAG